MFRRHVLLALILTALFSVSSHGFLIPLGRAVAKGFIGKTIPKIATTAFSSTTGIFKGSKKTKKHSTPVEQTDTPDYGTEPRNKKQSCKTVVEDDYVIYCCADGTGAVCSKWSTEQVTLDGCSCPQIDLLLSNSDVWCQDGRCNFDGDDCRLEDFDTKITPTKCTCEKASPGRTHCKQWSCTELGTGRDYRCADRSKRFRFEWEEKYFFNDLDEHSGCVCHGNDKRDLFCKEWWCGDIDVECYGHNCNG